jgi:hypothetical protein
MELLMAKRLSSPTVQELLRGGRVQWDPEDLKLLKYGLIIERSPRIKKFTLKGVRHDFDNSPH